MATHYQHGVTSKNTVCNKTKHSFFLMYTNITDVCCVQYVYCLAGRRDVSELLCVCMMYHVCVHT